MVCIPPPSTGVGCNERWGCGGGSMNHLTPISPPTDLTGLRLALLAQGYRPVPVLRHDALGKAAGKRPTLAMWQIVCSTADEAEIRRWAIDHNQSDNTGVLTGAVVGLDIDVADPALAPQIGALADAMLPTTPLVRIGRAPKSLRVFRAEGVHRKVSTPVLFLPDGTKVQIEALGEGNHFVSYGIHPETKQPYSWPGASPLDVPFDDLPVLPASTLHAFLAAAEAVMRAAGGKTEAEIKDGAKFEAKTRDRKPHTDRNTDFPSPTRQDVEEALRAVPNTHDWQGWVKIGAAIFDALADDGEDLFTSWSEQSSRNDPAATLAKWQSFRRSPMTTTDATLFYEARRNGWRPAREIERDQQPEPPPRDCDDPGGWSGLDEPPPDFDIPEYLEAVGADATSSLDPVEALIREFNVRYWVINEAGRAVIYEPAHDPILNRRYHNKLGFADFEKLHLNRMVKVGDKFLPAATVWLRHRDRRQYIRGVTFNPSGNHRDHEVLNLWQGFAVEPTAGRWDLMKSHIYEVICGSSHELYGYLLSWMARLIQFPAQQGEVAVVLKGIEGTGKGILARALLYILGQHGLAINHAKHLTGNFNAHLRDCVFLFADEAFFAGDRAHVGVLKSLITEPTLTIEAKYANAVQAPNFIHLMMASNEDWVVPASIAARRFLVLLTAATRVGNRAYFAAIQRQMEAGGYEAMLHELAHRDLTDFNVRDVPDTEGLQEQKKLSLGTSESWWSDCLHRGYVYQSKFGQEHYFGEWHDVMTTDILFASYTEFAKTKSERHPMAREAFGAFLGRMGATPAKHRHGIVGEHVTDVTINQHGDTKRMSALIKKKLATGYRVRSLREARDAFTDATKLTVQWASTDGDIEEVD
jgi:hypothetical protein